MQFRLDETCNFQNVLNKFNFIRFSKTQKSVTFIFEYIKILTKKLKCHLVPRVETILLMRCAPHTFTSHPQNNLSIKHWLTHLYLCTNVDAQTNSDMSDTHLYINAYAYASRGIGMYTSTHTHV